MPADHPVAVWLDAYRPDAVPVSVWDGGLSEFVGAWSRNSTSAWMLPSAIRGPWPVWVPGR